MRVKFVPKRVLQLSVSSTSLQMADDADAEDRSRSTQRLRDLNI